MIGCFIGETWGSAFGEDGGRIIAAKVQVSRFVRLYDILLVIGFFFVL